MALKPKADAVPTTDRSVVADGFAVEFVPVPARVFMTVRTEAEVGAAPEGAILRYMPAVDVGDVESARALEAARAKSAGVRLVKPIRAAVVVQPDAPTHRSNVREVVHLMIGESNTRDRTALETHAESIMGKAGV